jgi:hypothetical protein
MDPSVHGYCALGVFEGTLDNVIDAAFDTASPAFSASAPSPTQFSSFLDYDPPTISIDLEGVPGGLVINDLGSVPSASISSDSTPEPSTLSLAGLGLLVGLIVFARRRKPLVVA